MASRDEVEEGTHGGDDEHHAREEMGPEVDSFILIMEAVVPPRSPDEGACRTAWLATSVEGRSSGVGLGEGVSGG